MASIQASIQASALDATTTPAVALPMTLPNFDALPAHLRPTRVDGTPRPTTLQQQAAWRRLCATLIERTNAAALAARAG